MGEIKNEKNDFAHAAWAAVCGNKGNMCNCRMKNRPRYRTGGNRTLIVTQDKLLRKLAEKENISLTALRRLFRSYEEIIFNCLKETAPSESTVLKVLDGLSLECSYTPEKEIHTFDKIVCKPKIWARPKITRYYNRKLNGYYERPNP